MEKLFTYLMNLCLAEFCVIFGDIWEEMVFLNGLVKVREIRNGEDLM